MTQPKLTLYIGTTCTYCAKVMNYLRENPLEIEIKDAWADESVKEELLAMTDGRTQVPCLKIDDGYMYESLDIIETLKEIRKKIQKN